MRVLWFVNAPFPAVLQHLGLSSAGQKAWWMPALADQLALHSQTDLAVVWVSPMLSHEIVFDRGSTRYFCLPASGGPRSRQQSIVSKLRSQVRLPDRTCELQVCCRIIDDFKPDVIHVHGTEDFYGLIAGLTARPLIISLQGILTPYLRDYWGSLRPWRRVLYPGALSQWWWMRQAAHREREIIEKTRFFLGRTSWDRTQLAQLNSRAQYFHVGEILRSPFYGTCWSLQKAQRHRIYTTASATPYKGIDCLIDAVGLLRGRFEDVEATVGGDFPNRDYAAYLHQKIRKAGLEDAFQFVGYLETGSIVEQLRLAHVFVLPSYIDNSPNALCEAQVAGVPCVGSFVGGVPSLISDGDSGLTFSKGNPEELAARLQRIFEDDALTVALSRGGRRTALARHDPNTVVTELLHAYEAVHRETSNGMEMFSDAI